MCKMCMHVDRNEKKKMMKIQRQKQDYEAMEPSKKKILLEKKQGYSVGVAISQFKSSFLAVD